MFVYVATHEENMFCKTASKVWWSVRILIGFDVILMIICPQNRKIYFDWLGSLGTLQVTSFRRKCINSLRCHLFEIYIAHSPDLVNSKSFLKKYKYILPICTYTSCTTKSIHLYSTTVSDVAHIVHMWSAKWTDSKPTGTFVSTRTFLLCSLYISYGHKLDWVRKKSVNFVERALLIRIIEFDWSEKQFLRVQSLRVIWCVTYWHFLGSSFSWCKANT